MVLALQVRWGLLLIHGIPLGCTVILTLVLLLVGLCLMQLLHWKSPRSSWALPWPLQGPAQASAVDCRTPRQVGWRLSASFLASCTLWEV